MALTVTIAGTDRTSKILSAQTKRTLRISMPLGSRWTMRLTAFDTDSTASAYRPSPGEAIVLSWSGSAFFSGVILGVRDEPFGGSAAGVKVTIDAVNKVEATERNLITRTYASGQTLRSIVTSICTNDLAGTGITADPGMSNGPTMGEIVLSNISAQGALNQVTGVAGYIWRITPAGLLICFAPGAVSGSYNISAANGKALGAVTWTKTRALRCNRVFVVAGQPGQVDQTDTFTGDGSTRVFPLKAPVAQRPAQVYDVTAGAYRNVGIYGVDTLFEWTWRASDSSIVQLTEAPPGTPMSPLAVGQQITVNYGAQYPFTVTVDDSADIAANGVWAARIEKPEITDRDAAIAEGQTYLTRYIATPKQVTVTTFTSTSTDRFYPGDTITLTFADRSLPASTYLISNVEVIDVRDGFEFTLTCVEGTNIRESWSELLKQRFSGGSGGSVFSGGVLVQNPTGRFQGDVVAAAGGTGSVRLGAQIGSSASDGAIGPGIEIQPGLGDGPQIRLVGFRESLQRELVMLFNETLGGTLYRPFQVRHETIDDTFHVMPGPITNVLTPCYLGSTFDSFGNGRWAGAYLKACDSTNGYVERGRDAKIGDWKPVAFNAGNFAGVGATWTVSSGNQVEFKYRRTGTTLRGKLFLQGTTLSAAGASELDITLPAGLIAEGRNPGSIWLDLGGGTYEWGTTQTSDNGTVLKVFRKDPAATFGTSVGMRGEFEIETTT
jgi:hypothetical protein